jgi:hypothetical protein
VIINIETHGPYTNDCAFMERLLAFRVAALRLN